MQSFGNEAVGLCCTRCLGDSAEHWRTMPMCLQLLNCKKTPNNTNLHLCWRFASVRYTFLGCIFPADPQPVVSIYYLLVGSWKLLKLCNPSMNAQVCIAFKSVLTFQFLCMGYLVLQVWTADFDFYARKPSDVRNRRSNRAVLSVLFLWMRGL